MASEKLTVAQIKAAGAGKLEDGKGLRLVKSGKDTGKWVLRFTIHSKRREMGLGGWPDVSLAQARKAASGARALVKEGKDPIKARERARREAERNLHMLREVALDCFESRKAELKGDGKAGRWFSPLEIHVLPKLGKMPVAEIDQTYIRDTLAPIWHTKPDTARKAMNRLGIVMKHAAALGLDVDLQAVAKAQALLGKRRHQVQHIPSLDWRAVPGFYQSLDGGTVSVLALRLLILTGARSAPIRHLHIDQIDGDVWTVPAHLMKGREGATTDFRIPLSSEALDVIEAAKPLARDGHLFPGPKGKPISDMTLTALMKRREMVERPHGFRTSLRTWLAEATNAPHEVAEAMLAHTVDSAVVRSYRRTDHLEQRRILLERWASHVTGRAGEVVGLDEVRNA